MPNFAEIYLKVNKKPLFHILIATGFGSGYSPFAPGTAGAFLATLIWLAIAYFAPSLLFILTLSLIVVFTLLGIWSANVLEPQWGKDPSRIVVDEMVGVWIPLLVLNISDIYYIIGAFVLFRLFDIFKPLGIRKMENLKGGVGVMMDDILAGIYSLLLIIGAKWLIG